MCIACNQACLDYIFSERVATCLVNPKAGRELEFDVPEAGSAQAGRRCRRRRRGSRLRCRQRRNGGTTVEVFEASDRIGGQLNLARNVPGKEEFDETLRYWQTMMTRHGVRPASVERAGAGPPARTSTRW